jgi:oxygen-independent coproporphyrinogen-3 oxidase
LISYNDENSDYRIKIKIHGSVNLALMRELIDEFMPPQHYELLPDDGFIADDCLHINLQGSEDRDEIKREIFRDLYAVTGSKPDWGILTGVRPVKLAGEIMNSYREDTSDGGGSPEKLAAEKLMREYCLTQEKAELVTEIYDRETKCFGAPAENSFGIYIGIPFCPTRCVYCSFASNQVPDSEIERYMPALLREIEYCGRKSREYGMTPESLYIGGGTPTTLTADQLKALTDKASECFDMSGVKEFTVECGRPDTITREKLEVLRSAGVTRISINPQSMKQKTLDIIGRRHTPEDIVRSFETAASIGFDVINSDLIAGLPEEQPEDFDETLEKVISLGANNVTVHTLAVKRASRLKDVDQNYHYKVAGIVNEMLSDSRRILAGKGFVPYYLYRQKHMAGSFENTGYALPGTEGLYNSRIMDEHQSILALGAGGISKRYYPDRDLIIRVPNVTNYNEYISRIDEMCERKGRGFFTSGVPEDC